MRRHVATWRYVCTEQFGYLGELRELRQVVPDPGEVLRRSGVTS